MTQVLGAEPQTLSRRWLVIALATVALQFPYWLTIASSAVEVVDGEAAAGGPLLALGLGLVPIPVILLAFGTRHANAPVAVLKAMGLFLVVGFSLALLDPVVGLTGGFAVAGTVAIRRDVEDVFRWRLLAAGAATLYVLVLLTFAAGLALFTGAFVPFLVSGIADQVREAR